VSALRLEILAADVTDRLPAVESDGHVEQRPALDGSV